MIRRSTVLVPVAVAALFLWGCASDDVGTASAPGADTGATDADAAEPTADEEGPVETTSTVPFGPTTTFVPDPSGPFDLSGGAERGSDEGVIVDRAARDELPSPLSVYPWDTDWTRRTVEDWTEFIAGLGGSDPRDGIPPIDRPVFETTALASQWVGPREPGALVQVGDDVRFYPLSILTRHEIVNDAFDDVPVAVTYCPLCNTALAFDRRVDGEVLRFGVSGLLRNSDLVMWDDRTTSLWQQINGAGVVGTYAGTQLEIIPTAIVSFAQFAEAHPDGRSLAGESGFGRRSYGINPYTRYSSSTRPFLFDGEIDDRFEALSRVVGVDLPDGARAYPFGLLAERQVVNDVVGDTPVVVFWGGDTADALDESAISIGQAIGTALALDPVVDGRTLTFAPGEEPGTFVDAETGSTWTVLGLAVEGELSGTQLGIVPHRNEFWFAWQAFFSPDDVYEG